MSGSRPPLPSPLAPPGAAHGAHPPGSLKDERVCMEMVVSVVRYGSKVVQR